MTIEKFIRFRYIFVIPSVPLSLFVSPKQKDRFLPGIECEEDAHMPNAQFLHVGVTRHLDAINEGATERRAILSEDA